MRLIEFGNRRPLRAGKAKIEYASWEGQPKEGQYPFREGSVITVPSSSQIEMFPLMDNWVQFLIQFASTVWFGGTDENPFLVKLNREMLDVYLAHGPEEFYKSLIPNRLTKMCEIVGKDYTRQGDIFAVQMDFDWEELSKAYRLFNDKPLEAVKTKTEAVFGTRHILSGCFLEGNPVIHGIGGVTLVEGRITVPDHRAIELVGPHMIDQTKGLFDAMHAD